MKTLTRILMVSVLSLFLFAGSALAITSIDFGTGGAGAGGLVTLLAGPNLTGTNIPLDVLTVVDAPVSGIFDLSGAGPSTPGENPLNGSALLSFDTRTATNFVKIIGGVPALGIPDGTTLLNGTFVTFPITVAGNFLSLGPATGPDTKDPNLLVALGLDPNLPFNFFGFTLSSDFNGVTGTALSTDFANSGKIPEPMSLILLGSGLAGAGLYRRLRKPKG